MKRFAVLFLLLIIAVPIGAYADVLSDNIVIQQSGQNSQWNNGVMLGQSFKTDSSAYILSSVNLYMISVGGATGLLSIYTNDVSNRPGTLVGNLTSPTSFTDSYAVNTFTTSGISLNANSEYWVVLSKNTPGNGYLSWVYSNSNTGNGVGFNIGSGYGSSLSATDWTPFSHPFEMRVNANPAAQASTAYVATGGGAFGTIDLTTGVFTQLGLTGIPVAGLALVDTTLYAAGQGTGNNRGQLYSVNPSTGALMSIGSPTGIDYTAFGSYGGTLYALDHTSANANLYSINSSTGAATQIGPTNTGQSLAGYWALSTNSTALFFSLNSNLYTLNTSTGQATVVGGLGGGIQVGAIAEVGGVLYAGQDSPQPPLRIVTLNRSNGEATVVSDVTNSPGSNASALYGLAPINSASSDIFFPQVAVGGGWSTSFMFNNTGSTTLSGNLIMTDQQGNPWTVHSANLGNGSSFSVSIPSGGTMLFGVNALNANDPTKAGYVTLQSTGGSPSGVAIYQYTSGNAMQAMAGVLSSQPTQFATIPVNEDRSQGLYAAFAMANPTNQTLTVKLALVDTNGNVVNDTLLAPLAPGQQIAVYLHDELNLPTTFQGSVVLRAQGGGTFVAVALVQNQGLFTAVPVTPNKAPNIPN